MIKINKNIFINNYELYLKFDKNISIISDVHLGFIRALNKKGIFIPDNQLERLIKNLSKPPKKFDLLIINGDFLHEFSKIDNEVIKLIENFLDYILNNYSQKIIIIEGNHDVLLKKIFQNHFINFKDKVEIKDFFIINKFLITHGHKKIKIDNKIENFNLKNKILIIGHEHPIIRLFDGNRKEEFKIFLFYKDIIVLPSFNDITEGHDILRERVMSPYLQERNQFFNDFEIYGVYNGMEKYFFKVKDVLELNNN